MTEKNLSAQKLARIRWDNATPEQRKKQGLMLLHSRTPEERRRHALMGVAAREKNKKKQILQKVAQA